MNRKPRRVPFNPPHEAPYRRNNPNQAARSSRDGIIDEQLIQGAQNRGYFDRFRRDGFDDQEQEHFLDEPVSRGDDMSLDAFGKFITTLSRFIEEC